MNGDEIASPESVAPASVGWDVGLQPDDCVDRVG